jgi:uncharacterized protein HemX
VSKRKHGCSGLLLLILLALGLVAYLRTRAQHQRSEEARRALEADRAQERQKELEAEAHRALEKRRKESQPRGDNLLAA